MSSPEQIEDRFEDSLLADLILVDLRSAGLEAASTELEAAAGGLEAAAARPEAAAAGPDVA